jgi:UrcA family protein
MNSILPLAIILAHPAAADWDSAANRITVPYRDLDLTTELGRAKLDQRLRRAVRNVCEEPRLNSAEGYALERQCVEETLSDAVRQIELAAGSSGGKSRSR